MKLLYKVLFAILFVTYFFETHGQNVAVSWGEQVKSEKSFGDITILGWIEGYYYTIKRSDFTHGNDVVLTKVSKDMNIVFSRKVELEYRTFKRVFFELIDNQIHAFATEYAKEENKIRLVTQIIDLEGNLVQQNILKSFDCNIKREYDLDFFMAPNKKHAVLISTSSFHEQNYSTLNYAVIPINEQNNTIYFKKKISFGKEQLHAKIAELAVDKDLNIYSIFRSKEEFYDPYLNTLMVHNSNGELLSENKLKLENSYLDNLNLKINKNNQIFVSGMYSNVNNGKSSYSGFFFGKIATKTFNITSISSFFFSKEFFEKLDYKIGPDGIVDFNGTYALDILLFDTGGGYLLADHRTNNTDKFLGAYELLAMRFNEEGSLKETQVLLKDQGAVYGYYYNAMGYTSMLRDNKLYLFYSDHIDNLDVTRKEDLSDMKDPEDNKVGTFMAVFEEGTEVQKSILFYNKEVKGYLIPNKCYLKGEIPIISINNGKKVTYGRLNF